MVLRSVAEALEHQARTTGLGGVGPVISSLQSEFDRAQTELTKLVAK